MAFDSAKLNIHSLPPEILQQIAGYLNDSHRPSLFAFGLVSKRCHDATIPSTFYHIRLEVSNCEALKRDVDALVTSIARTKSMRHVHCLSIKGHLQLPVKPKIEGYKSGTISSCIWFKETGVDEILSDEEVVCYSDPHVVYDEPVIVKSSEEDLAWLPVLIYDCQNQFPPTLLDALHDYHPQCKLYHLTFRFRTLLWGAPYSYEIALATSPCLYSVKVRCGLRDSEGDDDFNQEAIMELAAGLAPNLKEVVIVSIYPESSWRYDRRPRESWRGLPGFVTGQSVGSLTSLSLLGGVNYNCAGLLRDWAKHTDFSHLQHLTLGGGYDCESIGLNNEAAELIIENLSFPRLKTLQIRLDRDDNLVDNPNYAIRANALLTSFEPLEQLSVSGPLEPKMLNAILDRHGPTLTKLSLRPLESQYSLSGDRVRREIPMTFTKEHISQIHAQCPVLEELTVSIKRTKSDAREAETYKSFGRMGRLRSLFLILDCSDWSVTRDPHLEDDPSFDTFDRENWRTNEVFKKGHVREAMMNCAVDETLARSIWQTICQNKVGQKLETLKLWTYGAGQFGMGRRPFIQEFLDNLSRSWLIERVTRDEGDIINVRELGQRAREARDQRVTEYMVRGIKAKYSDEVEQVLRRIWPRIEGSKDWRKDWSSLPLQV
ncbi:hypothetical protein ACMFMG_007800 [Clarireedia jacksonii]